MNIERSSSGLFALVAAAALLFTSCEHAAPVEPGTLQPTLESIQTNIFATNCALSGCHAGPNPQQGLDLSAGQARANLVNVDSREVPSLKRVDPGNPDDSYLVMKIEDASGIVGAQMPLGRPALSSEEISVIREWISQGAE